MLDGATMKQLIGWASSLVLILTIGKQVYKQWRSGTSEGVSKWLYLGQVVASTGFTIYSVLVGDWVFVVTNAVMLLSAVVGVVIYFHHRRGDEARGSGGAGYARARMDAS